MRLRVGVDLGGTKIEAVALGPDGAERARRRVATPAGDYDAILVAVRDVVRALEQELSLEGTVGVGTPGAIVPSTGLLKNANTTCLNGRPLARDLSGALGREVRVANDADCFALSEATDGAGRGARTVFGVILGTGTGGGFVVDGRLLSGPNGLAGEWGHAPLPWPRDDERPGPVCYCGKYSCIERWLSGPAIAEDHERVAGSRVEAPRLVEAAARGDGAAAATLARHADRLARGLAMIIDVVDPDVIVLGGGVSRMAHLYEEVPRRWGRYAFDSSGEGEVLTRLVPAVHGDASGVRGAAWLWPA